MILRNLVLANNKYDPRPPRAEIGIGFLSSAFCAVFRIAFKAGFFQPFGFFLASRFFIADYLARYSVSLLVFENSFVR